MEWKSTALNLIKIYKPNKTLSLMNKYLEILIGLVLLLAPIYAWIINWADIGTAATLFLKGGLVWLLLGIGAMFLIIGLSDLRD